MDKEEFTVIVRALGEVLSNGDIAELFEKSASGGQLSLSAFKSEVVPKLTGGQFTRDQIVEFFKVFDRDGNGKVSANEIRNVTAGTYGEPLSATEVQEILKLAQVDGEGQITYDDFVKNVLSS